MSQNNQHSIPNRVGIEGVSYSLAHVPDLVRFGSKPMRELRGNPALGRRIGAGFCVIFQRRRLTRRIRFTSAISRPETLRDLPQPWFEKLIEGATAQGRFGDLVDQSKFYALLAGADQFRFDFLRREMVSQPMRRNIRSAARRASSR